MPTAMMPATELDVAQWFNTKEPPSLTSMRGSVVAIHAFQMLCPGCVTHGIPQATKMHKLFGGRGVQVLGLHTVFEHHAAMTPVSLAAFIHEYRLTFPIAVDRHDSNDPLPRTMRAYGLQGTPSLLLFDRQGNLRHNLFGQVDDMAAGALVATLLAE